MSDSDQPKRKLLPREEQVIGELYLAKERMGDRSGYCTTTGPLPMGAKAGRIIPAGRTLKIVMVSRLGDCGLTDMMSATHGYEVRLDWDSALISDIRLTKEPTTVGCA